MKKRYLLLIFIALNNLIGCTLQHKAPIDTDNIDTSSVKESSYTLISLNAMSGERDRLLKLSGSDVRYFSENCPKYLQFWQQTSKDGMAIAQTLLAGCYLYGKGVAKDENEAISWFRKAAENGDVTAKSNLEIIAKNATESIQSMPPVVSEERIINYNPELKNDIGYLPNENTPFTGKVVKHHSNGQKKLEVTWKDGKLCKAESWFENGLKQDERNFKNRKPDGEWLSWYENGNRQGVMYFKDGQPVGESKSWYENGQKESETNWKGADKLQFFYDTNGNSISENEYANLQLKKPKEKIPDQKVSTPENKNEKCLHISNVYDMVVSYRNNGISPEIALQQVKSFQSAGEYGNSLEYIKHIINLIYFDKAFTYASSGVGASYQVYMACLRDWKRAYEPLK